MNLLKISNQYTFLFDVSKTYTPMKWGFNEISCTMIPEQAEAFSLAPLVSGWCKSPEMGKLETHKVGNKGLILRAVIGYRLMTKVDENFNDGVLILSNVINAMLCEAYQYKKDSSDHFKIVTFNRPGQNNNEFFRELEHQAGFELRLYIEF